MPFEKAIKKTNRVDGQHPQDVSHQQIKAVLRRRAEVLSIDSAHDVSIPENCTYVYQKTDSCDNYACHCQ